MYVAELDSSITTNGSNLLVTGFGGGAGSAEQNIGVALDLGGEIFTIGTAKLTVHGTSGATSGDFNEGVLILEGRIGTEDGDLEITGTGAGTGKFAAGVDLFTSGVISTNNGAITIDGTGSTTGSGSNNYGFWLESDFGGIGTNKGSIQITASPGANSIGMSIEGGLVGDVVATTDAPITLVADSIAIDSTVSITAGTANAVTIRPKTNGALIHLGGTDSAGTLGLTDTELDRFTAGTLNIGDPNSGAVTVSTVIDRGASTKMKITSGGAIITNPGSINTAGGTLLFDAGVGGVQPITSGPM